MSIQKTAGPLLSLVSFSEAFVDVLSLSLASEHQRVWHVEEMIGYTSLDAHVAGFGHSPTPKQDVCDV